MFFFGCHILTSNRCVHTVLSIKDRIAQSVERWSNKPLVRGSSPLVITSFVRLFVCVLDVAFVAERLRRYVQVVVLFEGVGSSPTECNIFFLDVVLFWLSSCPYHVQLIRITTNTSRLESEHNQTQQKKAAYFWLTAERRTKRYGGTGIRARVERITTANANHYTIPPRYATVSVSECPE
jgi:hypothetical protein